MRRMKVEPKTFYPLTNYDVGTDNSEVVLYFNYKLVDPKNPTPKAVKLFLSSRVAKGNDDKMGSVVIDLYPSVVIAERNEINYPLTGFGWAQCDCLLQAHGNFSQDTGQLTIYLKCLVASNGFAPDNQFYPTFESSMDIPDPSLFPFSKPAEHQVQICLDDLPGNFSVIDSYR